MAGNLEIIMTRYGNWESDTEKANYIDMLEAQIEVFNQAARDGQEIVADGVYDTCLDFLREVKPDSYLLHTVWSDDDPNAVIEDIDMHLVRYPMLSIQTVKHFSDKAALDFKSSLPFTEITVCNSIKENGHGGRVIWKDGHLVKATSRGRSTAGKDLTDQMKLILGSYCEHFEEMGTVEMRCEVLLPFDNLEKARVFNPEIKSAFSGVASMIRASATPEETALLDVVFYDILAEDTSFDALSEKLEFIESAGFKVPVYFTSTIKRSTFERDIEAILNEMDFRTTDYQYYTDGVVVTIDDIQSFDELGSEDKFRLGNLAIKMGRWKQDSYSGIVKYIKWENGKTKMTPVAVIEPVITHTGNTVQNIPLYAPNYILMLEAYPNNVIHFRYGGEAGVIPVTADGRLVTDKNLKV